MSKETDSWDEHYSGDNIMLVPDIRVIRWLSQIPREMRGQLTLLDLGCGNGRHSIWAAKMGFKVVATDYSPVAIGMLKVWSRIEGLDDKIDLYFVDLTKEGTVANLHLEQNVGLFDLVLCWGVLEYFEDPTVMRILSELAYISYKDARALFMFRGPKDFCYSTDARSDGFMDLHERSEENLVGLFCKQESWEGLSITNRFENFPPNIRVGGVKSTALVEHMIFIDAVNSEKAEFVTLESVKKAME